MNVWDFTRGASICAAAMLAAGCGGAQPPVANNAPGAISDAGRPRAAHGYESLYSFKGPPDGEQPSAGVTYLNGRFYGTTSLGGFTGSGCNACGTIYRITPEGREGVLYRFGGFPDGAYPESNLALERHNAFVGTTYSGGRGCSGSCGTIFRVTSGGSESVLYSFKGIPDGSNPRGGLLILGKGLEYGTTAAGGTHGNGTVYAFQNSKDERVLYSFNGETEDGTTPVGDLVAIGSTLYGVTQSGGASSAGTVFKINTSGGDESIVHSLNGKDEGKNPVGLAVLNGKLYGAATFGGNFGKGTIFEIDPDTGSFSVLHVFAGLQHLDGSYPEAPPIAAKGTLYGSTRGGGTDGNGIIFELKPNGDERVLYNFQRVPDGVSPYARLALFDDMLYGTTMFGGARRSAYGTVFRLRP